MKQDIPYWLLVVQITVTTAVAVIALGATTWIQINQGRVAKNKLKLDLFEQRYKFLEMLTDIATIGLSHPSGDDRYFQRMQEQYKSFQRYKLLFPSDIEKILNDIIGACDELWAMDELPADHSERQLEINRKVELRKRIRADEKYLRIKIEKFIRVDWNG